VSEVCLKGAGMVLCQIIIPPMEGFRVLEIAGLEGLVGSLGLGHVCLAVMTLAVIGLLFLVRYIISL
jgi:hypothetical protein